MHSKPKRFRQQRKPTRNTPAGGDRSNNRKRYAELIIVRVRTPTHPTGKYGLKHSGNRFFGTCFANTAGDAYRRWAILG